MLLLSRPRRSRRNHEWDGGKAVTFIVTLASTRSATLAARAACMSRKAAYALKRRDPAFAQAWAKAVEGYKVEEVEEPPVPPAQGNVSPLRSEQRKSFAALLLQLRESAPLAPGGPAQ